MIVSLVFSVQIIIYRLRNFQMKNILVVKSRKLIPLTYLGTQICIAISVKQLELNLSLHLALMVAATIAYLCVCYKDPGYVGVEAGKLDQQKSCNTKSMSSPEKMNEQIESRRSSEEQYARSKDSPGEKELQLGLQSKIECEECVVKSPLPSKKEDSVVSTRKYDLLHLRQDCIVEGELGKGLVVSQAQGFKPFPQELKQLKRWCSQCDKEQLLRVRHCLDCNRCVTSFDHHCPWVNNCIGQKNKLALLIFLTLQLTQFCGLAIAVGIGLESGVKKESIFLQVVLVCLSLVVLGMLLFQLYLISLSLNTWEWLRWNRIEYLMPFQQKKLVSLFNQGFKQNVLNFLDASLAKQPFQWHRHINPNANDCLAAGKTITERRLSNQAS